MDGKTGILELVLKVEVLGVTHLAHVCHFERSREILRPRGSAVQAVFAFKAIYDFRWRGAERFLPPRGHPALEMTNWNQLRNS